MTNTFALDSTDEQLEAVCAPLEEHSLLVWWRVKQENFNQWRKDYLVKKNIYTIQ